METLPRTILPKTPTENLLYATVFLAVETTSGQWPYGTGFFYEHHKNEGGRYCRLAMLVTNKHLLADYKEVRIAFYRSETITDSSARLSF